MMPRTIWRATEEQVKVLSNLLDLILYSRLLSNLAPGTRNKKIHDICKEVKVLT